LNRLRDNPSKRRVGIDLRLDRSKSGRTRDNRRKGCWVGVGDAKQKLQHSTLLLQTAAGRSFSEVAIAGVEIRKSPDTSRRLIVTLAKCFGKCRTRFQVFRVVGRDCLGPRNLGKRHHARVLSCRGRRRKGSEALRRRCRRLRGRWGVKRRR